MQAEGSSSIYNDGKLYMLKDNYIVFKFDNIKGSEIFYKLVSIDLSNLFGNFELNPLYGETVKNVKLPSEYTGSGVNQSSSVITDLAGNPLMKPTSNKITLSNTCVVDGEKPYIASVNKSGYMNNAALKNKSKEAGGDGTHNSDRLAGVGDRIVYTVLFNEQLKINEESSNISTDKFTATLNVRDDSSNYVALKSTSVQQVNEHKPGGGTHIVTAITFEPFTVRENMVCDDPEGKIRLISVKPSEDIVVTDISGNPYLEHDLTDVNTNPFYLDIEPPAVRTDFTMTGGLYAPAVVSGSGHIINQFWFRFSVSDNTISELSGVDDAEGSFRWINGADETKNFNFWYAVTASSTPPDFQTQRDRWSLGSTGQSYTFDQASTGNYIHIRLVDAETYNLGNTRLEITGYDIAGNYATETFPLDYSADTVAPSAEAIYFNNVYNNADETGHIKVDVRVIDEVTGLKSVEYAWVTDESESRTWIPAGSFASGNKTADITVNSPIIPKDGKYTGMLYFRVTDMSENTGEIYIGKYSYDLTAPRYTIDYTENTAAKGYLAITDLDDDSAALFMIKNPYEEDIYYVSVIDAVYLHGGDIFSNTYYGFGIHSWFANMNTPSIQDLYSWQRYKVTEKNGGYLFEYDDTPNPHYEDLVFGEIMNGTYYGTIEVKMLTGHVLTKTSEISEEMVFVPGEKPGSLIIQTLKLENGAFGYTVGYEGTLYTVVADAGTSGENRSPVYEYNFLLKAAPGIEGVYNAVITSPDIMDKTAEGFVPGDSSTYMLPTLKGVTFNISIGNTIIPEWGDIDIDYNNTYIRVYRWYDEMYTPVFTPIGEPLHLYQANQSITLPDWEYPTGEYRVELVVTSKAAGKTYRFTYPGKIYVDSNPASQEFGLALFRRTLRSEYVGLDEKDYIYYGPFYPQNENDEIPTAYITESTTVRLPVNGDFSSDYVLYFTINDMPIGIRNGIYQGSCNCFNKRTKT